MRGSQEDEWAISEAVEALHYCTTEFLSATEIARSACPKSFIASVVDCGTLRPFHPRETGLPLVALVPQTAQGSINGNWTDSGKGWPSPRNLAMLSAGNAGESS